ncbi:MAG: protein kinase [Myxococcota bacterium]
MVEDQSTSVASGAVPLPRDAPTIGGGRYVLVSRIAEGGMAGVYRAWDHKLRVWRAIKVLLPEFANRDVLRARFETEAKTMARLDHPQVIHVYDVGTREALPYMVMELAEGGTVNAWVEAYGKMPPRLAVDVVTQVALGLGAAHALGVVHRDVKPHNVLVTADGACKVTDFGIARVADQDVDGQTRTGATMGTIGYMAPEQRADAKLVDRRADIYALGALLYKLVTGKVMTDLFLVEHDAGLLKNVPQSLHEVIVRGCYHDRERRFPDTESMMRALAEVVDHLPEIPPDTPALPTPLASGVDVDASSGFPEIAVLVGGRTRTPVPLPYTMSRPVRRSRTTPSGDDRVPDYVDKGPPSLVPERPAPDPADAAEPDPTDPSLHPVTVERPSGLRLAPWIGALLGTTAVLWGLLFLIGVWGVYDLHRRSLKCDEARRGVYDTIEQERAVLPELLSRGASRKQVMALGQLYDVYGRTQGDPSRIRMAGMYVSGVAGVRDSLALGNADLANVRSRNLERAWHQYEASHHRWLAAAGTPSGTLARIVGLADPQY